MNGLSTEVDHLGLRLQPLFTEGRPVALQMLTPGATGKRKDPIITLTPGSSLGWPREWIIVSVINNGSCVLKFDTKRETARKIRHGDEASPRIAELVMAGIPAKLSRVLVTHLQIIIWSLKNVSSKKPQESHHGNSTSTSPQRPRRKSRCTPFRESAC